MTKKNCDEYMKFLTINYTVFSIQLVNKKYIYTKEWYNITSPHYEHDRLTYCRTIQIQNTYYYVSEMFAMIV